MARNQRHDRDSIQSVFRRNTRRNADVEELPNDCFPVDSLSLSLVQIQPSPAAEIDENANV